jgi:hypothetical protein
MSNVPSIMFLRPPGGETPRHKPGRITEPPARCRYRAWQVDFAALRPTRLNLQPGREQHGHAGRATAAPAVAPGSHRLTIRIEDNILMFFDPRHPGAAADTELREQGSVKLDSWLWRHRFKLFLVCLRMWPPQPGPGSRPSARSSKEEHPAGRPGGPTLTPI